VTIAATAATTASLAAPGSWLWLARHEGRLAWRDLRYLMTGGGRWRGRNVIIVFILLALGLHLIAFGVVGRHAHMTLEVGTRGFTSITGSFLLIFFLLLSQALEQVTRLFYGRGDLDLFRSSPASLRRIFVITQYQSESLNRHVANTYKFDAFASGFIDLLAADLPRAHAIEPQVLGDAIHPAVEPRAWLPLLHPRKSAHAGFLDEIVGLVQVSSEGNCEAPQTRQQLDHPSAELVRH